jgi:hypothetical protein
MRPLPARVLLSAIAIGAFTTGALYSRLLFFVVGLGAVALLATSILTSRWPVTRALQQFQGHSVAVRLWGSPPPGPAGALVLTAVNALGAGAHVFFSDEGGAAMHLKIAQPKDLHLASGRFVIGSAKYVQWNGRKIPRLASATAVSIERVDTSGGERPESVASKTNASE